MPLTQDAYLSGYWWDLDFKNPVLWNAHALSLWRKPSTQCLMALMYGGKNEHYTSFRTGYLYSARSSVPTCTNLTHNPDSFLRYCQSFQLLRWLWCWQVCRSRDQGLNFYLKLYSQKKTCPTSKKKKKERKKTTNPQHFIQWLLKSTEVTLKSILAKKQRRETA